MTFMAKPNKLSADPGLVVMVQTKKHKGLRQLHVHWSPSYLQEKSMSTGQAGVFRLALSEYRVFSCSASSL